MPRRVFTTVLGGEGESGIGCETGYCLGTEAIHTLPHFGERTFLLSEPQISPIGMLAPTDIAEGL